MRLAHREFGSGGEPLVLLHGVFGSIANWAPIARRLGHGRRVIAADLRNHGRSPHHPEMTYPAMVGDVLELMDHLSLPRCDLLGHSMGGKVAMALALERPQRVARLVVADMVPVAFPFHPSPVIEALRDLDLEGIGDRAEADRALAEAIPDKRLRGFLLQNLVRRQGRYHWRVNLEALTRHTRDLAGFGPPFTDSVFTGPALFVHGARSDYLRPEHEPAIRALFPAARITPIARAGHWLHAERPQAFTAAVEDFLAKTAGAL